MANSLMVLDEIEQVVINGDLSRLQPAQRLAYYKSVCDSLGLNPLTKPFDYIVLNGKMTLYAKRDATDQLRKIHRVSITKLERELADDIYTVVAYAQDKDGRTDSAIGAVNVAGLKGEARANAIMKSETKAKRRVTLSIVGLGWLDETEIETVPSAKPVNIDIETGEVIDTPAQPTKPDSRPVVPVAKPANGKKKIADDPMSQFWAAVKAADLSIPEGQRILAGEGGDPAKALNAVQGISQVTPEDETA